MPAAVPIILTAAAAASSAAGAAGVGFLGLSVPLGFGLSISVGAIVGGALSIAAALAGTLFSRTPDVGRQSVEATAPRPDAKPPKRLAIGRSKFGGRLVAAFASGRDLYTAHLIASHPCSVGLWDLYIDDRRVDAWTGDPFNMATGGAVTAPEVLNATTFWISAGDHTQAPQAWINAGVITAADRWEGLTMVWLKSGGVDAADFNKKYPKGGSREVQLLCDGGLWIDPATQNEVYTATPARVGYALLRHELGLGFHADDIDAASFTDAAVIEEAQIPLAAGGTHPRYAINGVIDLTSDRGDFIGAIQNAAASEIVLQGGKWAYLPGVARQSVMTLDQDRLSGPPRFTLVGDADQRFNTAQGTIVDPTLFTTGTLPLHQDSAALAADGEERLAQPQYPHVTDSVQGQRLDRIALRASRLQKSVAAPFGGRAIFLSEGDVVTTNFGLPFWTDGAAIIRKAQIQVSDVDGTPTEINVLELREYDPTLYDWSTADEQAYVAPAAAGTEVGRHATPATPTVALSGGGTSRAAQLIVARNAEAYSIEWQYSLNGGTDWIGLPETVIGTADPVTLRQEAAPSGSDARWRVRYTGGEKLNSDWAETVDYTIPGAQPIPPPSGTVASTAADRITIDWVIPNDARIDSFEIYRVGDQTEVDPLQGVRIAFLSATPGDTETYSDTGLSSGSYRYWARTYDGSAASDWSVPVDQTI